MTNEDDFHWMLDVNPDDWQTRLVFSEWLRDRDDPRADGMQALGATGIFPFVGEFSSGNPMIILGRKSADTDERVRGWHERYCQSLLPDDWFEAHMPTQAAWHYFKSRRAAEDAAALAFAKLPPERRAELLTDAQHTPEDR